MRTAVIIPTLNGNGPVLEDLLRALAVQCRLPDQVVVSVDGPTVPAPDLEPLIEAGIEARVVRGPRGGPAAARNRALQSVESDLVFFLNDDTVPEPVWLFEHTALHSACSDAVIGVGYSSWAFGREPVRVIDRLVSETSMVFFYDRMTPEVDRDWGYRHAWTLNLSLPGRLCRHFDERFCYPMFEDLEWGFRCTKGGEAVRYVPGAIVEHRHWPRYTPESLLRREALIGHQAWVLRTVAPDAFADIFGASIPSFASQLSDHSLTGARCTYKSLVKIADELGEGADIGAVFEACWPWRSAARSIGWAGAAAGCQAERALDDALAAISGSAVSTL